MSAHVTHIEFESTDYGLRAEIVVQRVPGNAFISERPERADMPDDIAQALRDFLTDHA